jgi:hypothetical protein
VTPLPERARRIRASGVPDADHQIAREVIASLTGKPVESWRGAWHESDLEREALRITSRIPAADDDLAALCADVIRETSGIVNACTSAARTMRRHTERAA